jgi:hypothetical protein
MKRQVIYGILVAMLFAVPALAEDSGMARKHRDVIRSIDLVTRTGVIGGYSYDFGSAVEPVKVTMFNASTGALEMLQPGMKVEVVYVDTDTTRKAISIEQLAQDEEVEF